MNVDQLSKMMEIMMMQNLSSAGNVNTGSEDDFGASTMIGNQNTLMFEVLLQALLKDKSTGEGTESIAADNKDNSASASASAKNQSFLNNASDDITNAIKNAASKYGVDEDLISAVVKQESGFNPGAVSKAGAEGLMQLMPKTAESLGVTNPFDVLQNVDGGTRYLKNLIDSFGGSKELALAAYNGGISRMNRRGVDTVEEINRMPAETQNYVNKVMNTYNKMKNI